MNRKKRIYHSSKMCDNVDTTLDKHLHKVDTIYKSEIVRVTICLEPSTEVSKKLKGLYITRRMCSYHNDPHNWQFVFLSLPPPTPHQKKELCKIIVYIILIVDYLHMLCTKLGKIEPVNLERSVKSLQTYRQTDRQWIQLVKNVVWSFQLRWTKTFHRKDCCILNKCKSS